MVEESKPQANWKVPKYVMKMWNKLPREKKLSGHCSKCDSYVPVLRTIGAPFCWVCMAEIKGSLYARLP